MANCKPSDCASCSSHCASRDKKSFIKPLHKGSKVKRAIAVVSGKGGVGKSLVTALLASSAQKKGYATAVLDADITGPSIPKMFGSYEKAMGSGDGEIYPVKTASGIQLMSMNCLLEHDDDPVVWRGTLIAGAAVQFWTDVAWEDVDIMFLDMPPGTGDVPLSVFQSIPLSGIVIVTTPQDLVEMIVGKAVNMAHMMNVPVLGLVENMSYLSCPDCGKKIELFGKSRANELGEKFRIKNVACLPVNPEFAHLADAGEIEQADTSVLEGIFGAIKTSREIKDYQA